MWKSCMRFSFRIFFWCFGRFVGMSSFFSRFKKKKKIPNISNPILLKSATRLAAMIRSREIKSEEVVRAYITRIEEVNPILNAIVQPRYLLAMNEAKEVDRLIESGKYSHRELEQRFPLLGIPVTIKESIAVKGMSNKAGRVNSYTDVAVEDSQVVSQLRAAGGIPIAVTNTPELCMCSETLNFVTGRTFNPYDTRRTCGGSSGGEAALLSSAASVIGVGSDIAGSLRIPAMYCGVFSHKPTARSVSIVGHVPDCSAEKWKDIFTLGPIVRYAEDLPLLTKVLKDPTGTQINLDTKVSMEKLTFYYMEGDNSGALNKIDADVKEAFEKVIKYFDKTYQLKVKKVKLKHIEYGLEATSFTLIAINGIDTIFSDPKDYDKWRSVIAEMIRKLFGFSKSIAGTIMYGVLKKIMDCLPKGAYEEAEEQAVKIRQEFVDLLQNDGVFFYPTMPYTATHHGEYFVRFLDILYLVLFNSIGLPATHCPLGLTSRGMPVGIQVVAGPGQDNISMAVCQELEKAFGGWVPPT